MHFTFRTTLRGTAALFALSLLQLSVSRVHAEDYKVGPIQITQPWARATPKGASAGAAYMTVTNSSTTAQHLNCVSSDAATECQDPRDDHGRRRNENAAPARRP